MATQMSTELKAALSYWMSVADSRTVGDDHLIAGATGSGLCCFLERYARVTLSHEPVIRQDQLSIKLVSELKKLLPEDVNGSKSFPFNHYHVGDELKNSYWRETSEHRCHLNPERVAWVRQQLGLNQ